MGVRAKNVVEMSLNSCTFSDAEKCTGAVYAESASASGQKVIPG